MTHAKAQRREEGRTDAAQPLFPFIGAAFAGAGNESAFGAIGSLLPSLRAFAPLRENQIPEVSP
ncbi:hypothetical protein [Stakelama tenebrarum]|uniref:Uncharacterized protein n=1 Tax=Stakelama tenebrarum TaxID=2711215 RepID=A0A6G6Y7C1_9SPHN|nr:hypothetical protein [Sphingosinithalassobacter tenebrarum]QIG80809.1 hypothetical protein G5C33_14100 [Sphingosinithalassobacter tenebrarum]